MNKKIKEINDNELLYLISDNNEEALEIMFKKYEPLILSKIKKFKFNKLYWEDYLQEGRLMLLKAIKSYDPNSRKTFNKYFDLILTNRFISIIRKDKKETEVAFIAEEMLIAQEESKDKKLDDVDFSKLQLSSLEKEIYKLRFLRNLKVSYICQSLNVSEKTVYNSIQRIKRKLKDLK